MQKSSMMFGVQPLTPSLLQPAKHRTGKIKCDNKLFCLVISYLTCCLLSGRQKNYILEYRPKKKVTSTPQGDQRKP